MSRNNSRRQQKQREKVQNQRQPTPNPPPAAANPLAAAFVVSTEFVDLPTRGMFYSKDSDLFQTETIEIKHMTAREEDILGNQDYISRGVVLDKLIDSILVDRTIKSQDLADIDKIAILVSARKTGYGVEYKQEYACNECGKEGLFVFNMENLINNANNEIRLAPENVLTDPETGTFDVKLEACGYTATCRVLDNEDFKYIDDLEKQRSKHSLDFNYTIEFLRRMVLSVHKTSSPTDITSDSSTISQFLDFIPAKDSRTLKQAHSYLSPTFRMHEEVECPHCSAMQEKEVPFSWAMFWSNL